MIVWTRIAIILGVGALLLPIVAALGSRFGLWSAGFGLQLFAPSFIVGAVVVINGVIGFVIAFARKTPNAKVPFFASALAGFAVSLYIAWLMLSASGYPTIHDITTDFEDPPMFTAALLARGPNSNPITNSAVVHEEQRRHYPDIKPWLSPNDVETTYERALETVDTMGWELVSARAEEGIVEATDTTFWFGFKDDVVVRVRAADVTERSVVDVRSVSRIGLGDVGTNAKRVAAFLGAMQRD